jgi:hypothetical protein
MHKRHNKGAVSVKVTTVDWAFWAVFSFVRDKTSKFYVKNTVMFYP